MIPLSHPLIGSEEQEAVASVLASGHLASGPEVEKFEAEFGAFVGSPHAAAVANGTAALHLGLMALELGPGDEVIVPSFSFAATANAVRLVGATPVFVDVDPSTYCINATLTEEAISPRTAAVVAVHLYGLPAPMVELRELADRHGIALVEDAAQAHGALWDGKPVGSWGDVAAFSFYPTKNMTTGEGGMITTGHPSIARTVRLLRNQGMERRYVHDIVGLNQRMTDLAAAIGRVQLRNLPSWNAERRKNAAFYDEELGSFVATPRRPDRAFHVYHQYTIQVDDRPRVIQALEDASIGYGIYYPIPIHLQAPYADLEANVPETERLATRILSIPVRPDLKPEERERVADVIAGATSR